MPSTIAYTPYRIARTSTVAPGQISAKSPKSTANTPRTATSGQALRGSTTVTAAKEVTCRSRIEGFSFGSTQYCVDCPVRLPEHPVRAYPQRTGVRRGRHHGARRCSGVTHQVDGLG